MLNTHKLRSGKMRLNPEKLIYILVPLYLLLLVFGKNINEVVYSILSFVLGISMLYLAYKLLKKQRKERK
jgi:heme O synthase-like polyprenyltransferase